MKTLTTNLVLSFSLLTVSGASQAALFSEDSGQLVYDNTLNITWLADANLAATNNFGVSGVLLPNGYMTWTTAQNWIGAMNTANYLGYNDWRLPTTVQPDATCSSQSGGSSGSNCTGSETGELFYNELGGSAGSSIVTIHNANLALFNNVQSDLYWSGTEYVLSPTNAWNFNFSNGSQLVDGKDSNLYAWAVRTGDVTVVPLPPAVWLFGSGLLGLVGIARRRISS